MTTWMRRLVLVCSALFTIGTALQNFVIVNEDTMTHMMRLAGQTDEQAAANAPGFLTGFRIVGCVYLVGNAVGLLAFTGWTWVFWTVLAVNAPQAAGVFVIPPEVFEASIDRYGVAGVLPSAITDGGALLLTLVLLVFLFRGGKWRGSRGRAAHPVPPASDRPTVIPDRGAREAPPGARRPSR